MGNPQHLEWLLEGVKAWNTRRKAEVFEPDLSGLNIFEAFEAAGRLDSTGNIPLECADLRGAVLTNTDLRHAKLKRTDLRLSDLRGAILSGADIGEAYLEGAKLNKADLQGAFLETASRSGSLLSDAIKEGAGFGGAMLSGAILGGADLTGALFKGAIRGGAGLGEAILEGTNPIAKLDSNKTLDSELDLQKAATNQSLEQTKAETEKSTLSVKSIEPEDAQREIAAKKFFGPNIELQVKSQLARDPAPVALLCASLVAQIEAYRFEIYRNNRLASEHPIFRSGLFRFLDDLTDSLNEIAINVPTDGKPPTEDNVKKATSGLQRFTTQLKSGEQYFTPENLADASKPVGIILGCGTLGGLLGGLFGGPPGAAAGFGGGSFFGQMVTKHLKPGAAAEKVQDLLSQKDDHVG